MTKIELIHGYCEEGMKDTPDNFYELAIVDPPYGIGYEDGGQYFKKNRGKKWDLIPDKRYFDEVFRVSENQIIWGANYFELPPTRCILAWYKTQELKDRTFSEFELAWTSFDTPARLYWLKPFQRNGTRIHPTQKPVALYKWLLKNYAKPGDKILDTHGGSFSSVIACIEMGFDVTAYEIDKDYFDAAVKRVWHHINQLNAFIERPEIICNGIPIDEYIKLQAA